MYYICLPIISMSFVQLTDDVARKKTEYQKSLEVYKLMRSRFEEHYVKCKYVDTSRRYINAFHFLNKEHFFLQKNLINNFACGFGNLKCLSTFDQLISQDLRNSLI